MKFASSAVACVLLACLLLASGNDKISAPQSPLAPPEALKHFRLADGLRMELVASEPQIESPVAMAFDPSGRIWVVEMCDYPNGPKPGEKPAGRIRILEDKDGDGRFEHSSVFAEDLLYANGLMLWQDGVIVTAAPHIIFLRDSDGDGRADVREVLYEGFAAQNPQLRVSHPNLGVDNWIYVANGLRGGIVKGREARGERRDHSAPLISRPSPSIDLAGMDFRFDLIRNRQEAISGVGQYGNTFDSWGQRFVCDNRHHLRHIVFENRYLKRNPFLAAPALVEDISVLKDGPLNSGGKIYPISKNWTTSSLHEGRFTAACGVYVYRGAAPQLAGVYTCDPTGNLVHQEVMTQHGATFRSAPVKEGVEFLASPDEWFRPVFLTEGPDGALYLVDMYRAVIEHPQFMPPELQNRLDLTLGKERGRIWRIVSREKRAARDENLTRSPLSARSTPLLVKLLEHPEPWWHSTAQRLLLERQDRQAIEPLREMLGSKSPQARLRAAWLLENFTALGDDRVLDLLQDPHPRLREHAVLLAEPRLARSTSMREAVLHLATDADPRVRFQVALTLGEWNDDRMALPLTSIALSGAGDPWTRLAVLSSVPERAGKLFQQVLASGKTANAHKLVEELAALMGARRDAQEIESALLHLTSAKLGAVETAALNGLAAGMERRGSNLGSFLMSLPSVSKAADRGAAPLARWYTAAMSRNAAIAADNSRPTAERLDAVRLLAHVSTGTALETLVPLLKDDPLQEVRLAAVRSLAGHGDPAIARVLMESWRSYTPALRREVSEAMLRQPARIQQLLDELQAGRVKPGDLDVAQARRLLAHRDSKIRDRARQLLQESLPAERKQVLAQYQAALKMEGDAVRGREAFKKHCATCHHIAGIGINVGPDIGDTRVKTPETLLHDILNPNQAIDNNFINYLVVTRSGKSLTGIITAETASSLTLQRAEGQKDTVLRSDVDEILSSGISLMPEGLEKNIPVREMADLLSFLKNWRYLDGAVPLQKR